MDSGGMRGEGRTGFGGLLREECEERPGENWTGKGGEKIGWAGTRSVRVAEERERYLAVRRRELDGHSCWFTQAAYYKPRLPTASALEKIPLAHTAKQRDYGVEEKR